MTNLGQQGSEAFWTFNRVAMQTVPTAISLVIGLMVYLVVQGFQSSIALELSAHRIARLEVHISDMNELVRDKVTTTERLVAVLDVRLDRIERTMDDERRREGRAARPTPPEGG